MDISVVVIAKNEQENIGRCLRSVGWADEIILIDGYSEDKTRKIAEKFSAQVYQRKLGGNFAAQRNYGIKKAKNEWVLFIDADETIPPDLAYEIQNLPPKTNQQYNAFKIPRIDYMWGKEIKYGDVKGARLVRLGRKKAGKWKRAVHEVWDIQGKIGELKNPILHYPHKNITEFLEKVRIYAFLHASQLEKEGVKANFSHIVFLPAGKFLTNYIFKLGFLDGTAGFIHAAMMSFHSFIARAELWLKQKSKL